MPMQTRSKEAVESLRNIGLFSTVHDEDLESVASLLIERRFPKHKTIVEEGLPGDYMYIIREGRVSVSKLSDDGREKILEFLEAGDFFGEMSLLDNAPRSASVRALSETRILALSRADFLAVLKRSPVLAMAVIQELTGASRQGRDGSRRLSRHTGAHPPADRRHDRDLTRDRHTGPQGPARTGLAQSGRQALPGARRGLGGCAVTPDARPRPRQLGRFRF
jgi:CRP-like cAMP-binding protein